MKNLLLAFFLLFGLTAQLFGQNLGIVIVPKATIYSQPDELSRVLGTLLEADYYPAKIYESKNESEDEHLSEPSEWYEISLQNNTKGYVSSYNMALFSNTISDNIEKINIDGITYHLLSADQDASNTMFQSSITTPFLFNLITKKAYFIRAAAHRFSLGACAYTMEAGLDSDILQYANVSCGWTNASSILSIEEELLTIKSSYNYRGEEKEIDEEYINTFSIILVENGQFWAIHAKPKNLSDYKAGKEMEVNEEEYYFFIASKEFSTNGGMYNDATEATPVLINQKTGKTYNIYVKSPANAPYLFDKPYMSCIYDEGIEDGYMTFAVYGGWILVYVFEADEDENGNRVHNLHIFWYQLEAVPNLDMINAKPHNERERHIRLN